MKNIVIADQFQANELKPSVLLKQYIAMVEKEVSSFFPQAKLQTIVCPACGQPQERRHFSKFVFQYHECANCLSLYVSPRPDDQAIEEFYKKSQARAFWNEQLYSSTAPRRQEKIIKPRFQWVEDSTFEYLPQAKSYADVNANQPGYLTSIAAMNIFKTKTLINPLIPLPATLATDGIQVKDVLDGKFDVITLFEVLDHTSDAGMLLKKISNALNPGGLCFLTGILSSGFDVSVLCEHAENIYPPDRLNVFSIKGIQHLVQAHGFECLEVSTPGILDVDFVAKALKEDAQVTMSPFLRDLVLNGSPEVRHAFQEFLQSNLLSSYGRILIRKA